MSYFDLMENEGQINIFDALEEIEKELKVGSIVKVNYDAVELEYVTSHNKNMAAEFKVAEMVHDFCKLVSENLEMTVCKDKLIIL